MSATIAAHGQVAAKRPLPEGWRWARLGDVCDVIGGSTPDTNNPSYWSGEIAWVTPTDLGKLSNKTITKTDRYITPVGLDSCSAQMLPAHAVIMSSRAPIGHLAIAGIALCTNQGCKGFVPNSGIDSLFLYWTLKNYVPNFQALGSGATFTEISKSALQRFEIPLPPLPEQQRIASLLDERMATAERASQAAEEMLASIDALKNAFLREIFALGKNLASGWRWVTLEEVCGINPKRPYMKRSEETPTTFVPMESVDAASGTIAEAQDRPYGEIKRGYTYFAEGDVLFSKITPCMQNGKHVIARGLTNGFGFGTTEFHVLRPGDEILPEWIHHFVRRPEFLMEATYHFTGAVGQQRLPPDYLAASKIPLPPLPEQRRIVALLDERLAALDKAVTAARAQLDAINALPAAWLRLAFDGELC